MALAANESRKTTEVTKFDDKWFEATLTEETPYNGDTTKTIIVRIKVPGDEEIKLRLVKKTDINSGLSDIDDMIDELQRAKEILQDANS